MGAGWISYFLNEDHKFSKPRPGMFKRIWCISRVHWLLYFKLVVVTAFTNLAAILSPILIMNLIDSAIPDQNARSVHLLGLGLLLIPLLITSGSICATYLRSQLSESIIFDLRCVLYEHLQHMSIRFLGETRTGELMSRLNSDVNGAQTAVTNTVMNFFSNIFSFCFAFIAAVTIEWRIALLGLVIMPLFIVPAKRMASILRDARHQSMERIADMYAMQSESLGISGALLVKIFGQEQRKVEQFKQIAASVYEIGVKTTVIGQSFFSLLGLVGSLLIGIIYWSGGVLVLNNEFTIGSLVACVALLGQIYDPLMSLANMPVELAAGLVSFERVFEVLDLPIEIRESSNAISMPKSGGKVVFKDVGFDYFSIPDGHFAHLENVARLDRFSQLPKNHLTQENVENSSPEGQSVFNSKSDRRWALKNINFEVRPGQLVALVGPSGAGKTTLTYLIPRLYDPTCGQIYIDNIDIKKVTLDSLIGKFGMVTQETYLFYDSIRANLLFAHPGATENEMIEAARAANIHKFVTELPEGYNTLVGERGFKLSGGEKQRIAIARVILKDPEIVILDEATSQLDSLSEALIKDAMFRVLRGRTSFVVAHRLSTILSSDAILVLKDGEIVERGIHSDLLANGGLYSSIYHTQFNPA